MFLKIIYFIVTQFNINFNPHFLPNVHFNIIFPRMRMSPYPCACLPIYAITAKMQFINPLKASFQKMYLKITACRYVAPCSLVGSYECFEEITASFFRVTLILVSNFLSKLLCMKNDYTYL